jgi:hypothetical protein
VSRRHPRGTPRLTRRLCPLARPRHSSRPSRASATGGRTSTGCGSTTRRRARASRSCWSTAGPSTGGRGGRSSALSRLAGHDWGTAVGYQAGLNRPERFSRFLALGGLTLWSSAGAPPRLFLRQWHIPALGLLGHYATTRLGISETRYGAGAMPGGSRARRSRPTRSPCVERCPRTPLSSTTAPRLRTLLAEERPEVVLERMTAFFGE